MTRTLQVNDGVGGDGFIPVPRHMLGRLSPNALALWIALLSHGWRDGRCWPGQETLMAETRLGEHPLRKAKGELILAGLLSEVRRGQGKPNIYRVSLQGRESLGSRNDDSSSLVAMTGSSEVEEEEVEEDSLRSSSSEALESSRPQSEAAQSNVKTPSAGSCTDNDVEMPSDLRIKLRAANGVVALCGRLAELMRERDPKAKVAPDSLGWMDAAEKLMRIDERHFEEAIEVLEWSQRDSFWQSQILSMPNFRKHYMQLRGRWSAEKLQRQAGVGAAAAPQASVADLVSAYDRHHSRTGVS